MDHPVSALNLFTLGAVIVVIVVAYIWHLRSRKNRAAAKRAHGLEE